MKAGQMSLKIPRRPLCIKGGRGDAISSPLTSQTNSDSNNWQAKLNLWLAVQPEGFKTNKLTLRAKGEDRHVRTD